MAGSDKVAINVEHLKDNDGTVVSGLEMWSSRNPPVTYNSWQSLYFQLIGAHGLIDAEAPGGETAPACLLYTSDAADE